MRNKSGNFPFTKVAFLEDQVDRKIYYEKHTSSLFTSVFAFGFLSISFSL